MSKILIIVDPQNDFCEGGSLGVDGATNALENLANDLKKNSFKIAKEYDRIIVTKDWHPITHCSFKDNGGIWPQHCVRNSRGAEILPSLNSVLYDNNMIKYDKTHCYYKGNSVYKEEYSIFDSSSKDSLVADINNFGDDSTIHICGLCGDYCVLETTKGAVSIFGKDRVKVVEKWTASIDNGEKIHEYCSENKIEII